MLRLRSLTRHTWLFLALFLAGGTIFLIAPAVLAADVPAPLTAEEEHLRSLELLGIENLRPGANGNDLEAPNAVNYDESLATLYPNLPDPLFSNGREVINSPEQWRERRRPEIVEMFDRELYGRVPDALPAVEWEINADEDFRVAGMETRRLEITGWLRHTEFSELDVGIKAIIVVPAEADNIPLIMQFAGGFFLDIYQERAQESDSWQADALGRGWGYAYLDTASIQQDSADGLSRGVIGLGNDGNPRAMDDWGVLRAWGWGASQVLDYLDSLDAVDATRVALEGHSRWGKAALVAMAYDQRFATAYISSSGTGGAKLYRRDFGERVENLAAQNEFHWMAVNFLKYAGPLGWDDLPVDAHELIALCAPRPLFISSGLEGDEWVDARGMFLATAAAQAVYELLGARGMGSSEYPGPEVGLMDGELAFRQHSGGHTDGPNWPHFLDFASRYLE